jgi:iron complex outermembrane receptor protein
VSGDELHRGRATLGLNEALATVPGLLVANRYNYTQDLRISIRGFGARAAFGVRGVKVLLDGIPQTLPDGQGQLSNVEVSELDRVEVLRGPSSSLHGNASGGVISLVSRAQIPTGFTPEARLTVGATGSTLGPSSGKYRFALSSPSRPAPG